MLSEPVNAGLFCGSLLRGSGGSFLLGSLLGSGGRGLLGSFGLDAAGSDGRLDGVGREYAQQADDDCQAPGSFLYEVGGLAVAHELSSMQARTISIAKNTYITLCYCWLCCCIIISFFKNRIWSAK